MSETTEATRVARPHFIPLGIGYEELPAPMQAAMIVIVGRTYEEHVVRARNSLVRSAGTTLVFLLCLEILDQFEIGRLMDFAGVADTATAAKREKLITRHLSLVAAKQRTESFLMRLATPRPTKSADPSRTWRT